VDGGGNFEIGMSGRLSWTSFTLGGLGGLGVLTLLTDLEVLLFLLESATFGVGNDFLISQTPPIKHRFWVGSPYFMKIKGYE